MHPGQEMNLSDFLNRKKELLKKRETLLVEIGLDILKSSQLPEGYQNLPKDHQRTAQMLGESQERLVVLEKKLAQYQADKSNFQKRSEELKKKEEAAVEPFLKRIKELEYPGEGQKADPIEFARTKQKLGEEKNRYVLLNLELKTKQKECEKQIRACQIELDETRSNLDILEETSRKRLRDLAYDYYQKNKKDSSYATTFGHYRLIQLELQELNAQEKPSKGLDQIKNERNKLSWLWVPSVILLTLLVFLFAKSEFSTKEIRFPSLAQNVPMLPGEVRMYFTSSQANSTLVQAATEAMKKAMGIEILDKEASSLDFSRILFSQTENGALTFLVLEFKTPRKNLENGFLAEGWTREKNAWSVEAFMKDDWVWYQLNPSQFLYYPKGKSLPTIHSNEEKDLILLVHSHMPAYNYSYPIVAGYSEFHLEKSAISFQWTLKAETEPADLELRRNYLNILQERKVFPSGFHIAFEGSSLKASGPASLLLDWKTFEDCIRWVSDDLTGKTGFTDKKPVPPELFLKTPQINPVSNSETPILKFNLQGNKLVQNGSARIPEEVTDLFVSGASGDLWLLNPLNRRISIYNILTGDFIFKKHIEFPDSFSPTRMIHNVKTNHVVLFSDPKPPQRFSLVDLEKEEWLSVTAAPAHIESILSADWSTDPQTLFMGVTTSGTRGQTGHGLLVYKFSNHTPKIGQLVDFPISQTSLAGISSLIFNESKKTLYALNIIQGMLQFFEVENGLIGPTNGVLLNQLTLLSLQSRPVFHSDPFQMALTRNQKGLVLLDFTDYSGKNFGEDCFLMDLESNPPIMLTSLQIGNSPKMVRGFPLSNYFAAIAGQTPQLILFHKKGSELQMDSTYQFEMLIPDRLAIDPLGETLFLACRTK